VGTDLDFPVAFGIDAGYQQLTWTYEISPNTVDYKYDSFYAGLDVSWLVDQYFRVYLETRAPVYPWVLTDINFDDPKKPFLLSVTLGASWKAR
jgi:hypothetical protein